jgi:hypothetical protein
MSGSCDGLGECTWYNGRCPLTRTDVMRGARFSLTGPGRSPCPSPHSFPSVGHARPLCGDECMGDVRWVRAELFNRRPQAGTDGQENGGCVGHAMAARGGIALVGNEDDPVAVTNLETFVNRTSLNFGSCPTGNVHSVQGEAPV